MSKYPTRATWRRASPLLLALTLAACSGGGDVASKLSTAQALLDKSDARAAVIELKNVVQEDPKSAEGRLLLGKALLETGDVRGALVELQKAQELQAPDEKVIPEIARTLLLLREDAKLLSQYSRVTLKDDAAQADLLVSLAAATAGTGDVEGANRLTEDALKLKPEFPSAMVLQARLALAAKDVDGAMKRLDAVLAKAPGHERAALLKAELLLATKQDREGAMALYRAVVAAKPTSVTAQAAIVDMLLGDQKVAEAKAELDKLKKVSPNSAETLLLQGQMAYRESDEKATRDVTDRILKALPDNLRALELAGANELRAKNYPLAESHLSKVVKAAPNLLRPRLLLAQAFLGSGQPEKTIELLKPLLDLPQGEARSLSLAGAAYLQMGDAKKSEEAYKRALKADPKDPTIRAQAAVAQLSRGENTGAAMSELEAAAAADSGSRADMALISARIRAKDFAGAMKAIDDLDKKMPDKPLAPLLRGRLLLLQKDTAGAATAFQASAKRDPAYFAAVAGLAAIDVNAGKLDAAKSKLDEFIKANPRSSSARKALAELQVRMGATRETVTATLRDAVKANPTDVETQLALINRLIASGERQSAVTAAQEALVALPASTEVAGALGRAQTAAGDTQGALATLNKVVAQQRNQPQPLLLLAEAQAAAKDRAGAEASLKKVLELQPTSVQARINLVMLAVADKKWDRAIEICREQQKLAPKDPSGFELEGNVEMARRNADAAAAAYRQALQRDKVPGVAARLHAALLASGKAAEAEKFSAEWLRDQPKDPVFLFYLGDVAMAKSDFSSAEQRYRTVLEVQPNNALALNNLAWMMARQNKPGAVATAEKANNLLPDRPAILDTLSYALESENKLPKAIEFQQRAVRLAPEDGMLTLRLAKLYAKSGDKARAKSELEPLVKLGDKFPAQAEVAALLKTL